MEGWAGGRGRGLECWKALKLQNLLSHEYQKRLPSIPEEGEDDPNRYNARILSTWHTETQKLTLRKLNLRAISSLPHSWLIIRKLILITAFCLEIKVFPHYILEAGEMGSILHSFLLLPHGTLLRFLCVTNIINKQVTTSSCRTLQFSSVSQAPPRYVMNYKSDQVRE